MLTEGDYKVFALQGTSEQLAYVDRDHNVVKFSVLEFIEDIHGIAKYQQDLVCVSSGTNQIRNTVKLQLHGRNEFDGLGLDVEHLNDICLHQDKLIASKFGRKRADGLRNGCVFEPLSGVVLLDGLSEPHSVVSHNGCLYVLDSKKGAVIKIDSLRGPIPVVNISGYARGLCFSDRFILIGCSKRRTQSRKGGRPPAPTLFTSEAHSQAADLAGVYIYDTKSFQSIFVDVSHGTDEIYQIIEIN